MSSDTHQPAEDAGGRAAGPPAGPFGHVPRTAAGHFLLNFYAAVHLLLHHVRRFARSGGGEPAAPFAQYPFLGRYGEEIALHFPPGTGWDDGPGWWEREIASWEDDAAAEAPSHQRHLPLAALSAEPGLGFTGRMALLVAGLVEEDSRFGTVIADLQAPLPHRRPGLELVTQVVAGGDEHGAAGPETGAAGACHRLVAGGFLEVPNRDAPRSEWLLRVPPPVWDAVRGAAGCDDPTGYDAGPRLRYHAPADFPTLDELIGPKDFLARVARLPAVLAAGQARAVVLRGMPGTERVRILGGVARALGLGVVEVAGPSRWAAGGDGRREASPPGGVAPPPPEQLGAVCRLTRSMPVLTYDLAPGETAAVPAMGGYAGPIGVVLGTEGGLTGRGAESAVTLHVPVPSAAERLRHWEAALSSAGAGPQDPAQLREVAERFHLPGGYIRDAAPAAAAHAALAGRRSVTGDDVHEACRALGRQLLDSLAGRLDGGGTWDGLVVAGGAAERLRELEHRCRHRERLLSHLGAGFSGASNRGVRALLSGPSGTGKTLAARVLAAALGMDLYRVDLAAVVNKYIGETEKNLHQVLSAAESLDVVLLLDEGDALMGSRTAISSSNDRYANLETNYLLQRLEGYQGVVLVTTNAGENIDRAFRRRMDVVVHFLPPGPAERWRIWQLHLPPGHAVDEAFLEDVCVRCALTGGQVRNAAQHATLMALGRPGDRVTSGHVADALLCEYRKAGAVCPLPRPDRGVASDGGVEAFVAALTNDPGDAPPAGGAAGRVAGDWPPALASQP